MSREQDRLARLEAHHLELLVYWHHEGMHRMERCDGCPYCFPPGRWGDYRRGPTYREILEGK